MAKTWPRMTRMCLVGFAWKTHPRWRLVMAGNRDELHARPTAALARWTDAAVIAGRDRQAGGTWMALGSGGRVAVVTNVRDGPPKPFSGPSRGALPARFVAAGDDAEAAALQVAGEAQRYAPFNLILADARTCVYVGNHPTQGPRSVPAGAHAISNGDFDAPWPKTLRLRATLQAWASAGTTDLEPLWNALADETVAPDAQLPETGVGIDLERKLSPAFVRGQRYGTRASTLLLIDHAGSAQMTERRYGPGGAFLGSTTLTTAADGSSA